MSAKPVKESLVEGRGAQVPLKKGGKGRRPWGLSWQIREPEVRRSRAVSPKTPPPFEPQPPIERPDFVARISVGKSAANLECASLLALWFAAAVQARCPYHKTTTPRRISLHCGAGFQPADRLRASQTEGLTLLCPSYEGGPQGVSGILDTPCRKVRGEAFSKLRFPCQGGHM